MVWHLIAAIFAGLASAGIGLTLRVISGKRLPRWIVPVFAGLGMLGYQIHFEYSWYDHRLQQLPESTQVIEITREGMFWRPWTYFFPMVTAFSVVDTQSLSVQRQSEGRLVEFLLYRFEKQVQDRVTTQNWLMNCATREALPLEADTRQPLAEHSRQMTVESPLYQAVCLEG